MMDKPESVQLRLDLPPDLAAALRLMSPAQRGEMVARAIRGQQATVTPSPADVPAGDTMPEQARAYMRAHGVTQEELGRRLGITRAAAYQALERDPLARRESWPAILRALGLRVQLVPAADPPEANP